MGPSVALAPPRARLARERLWFYLTCIVRGNLGSSYASGRPVVAEIGERILPTMFLVVSAVWFSAMSGLLLGVLASSRPASPADFTISVCCLVWHSILVFWLGQLLLLCMALGLDFFPAKNGFCSRGATRLGPSTGSLAASRPARSHAGLAPYGDNCRHHASQHDRDRRRRIHPHRSS